MKKLIQLACSGDERAFEQLVHLHKSKLKAAEFYTQKTIWKRKMLYKKLL